MEASKAMVSSPSGRFWPAASPPHVARSRKNEAKTAPAFAIMDSSRGHRDRVGQRYMRSEEHTSELQSLAYLVCRLLLEKKKKRNNYSLDQILHSVVHSSTA